MGPTGGEGDHHVMVTRTFLEMAAPSQLSEGRPARVRATLERIQPCPEPEWRQLYRQIGAPWHWHDRDTWDAPRLISHLARPEVAVYRATVAQGDPSPATAGFFELERHADGSVEIAYLGLDRAVLGLGLGAWLVASAVRAAFALGAARVWLHTCTLDAPAALPNYLARGFIVTRVETYHTTMPAQP
jgi:GNAT superfamily N-acetyltransferase